MALIEAGSNSGGQTIDLIFAWLIAEDDGAKSKLQLLFVNPNESFAMIKASLQGMSEPVNQPYIQSC